MLNTREIDEAGLGTGNEPVILGNRAEQARGGPSTSPGVSGCAYS
jgi:hypothetical protein